MVTWERVGFGRQRSWPHYFQHIPWGTEEYRRSRWPRGLRRGFAALLLQGLRVRIPPVARTSVCCECCVLLGTGHCVGLINRPEESGECGVSECDREASIMRPRPSMGCCAMEEKRGTRWKSCQHTRWADQHNTRHIPNEVCCVIATTGSVCASFTKGLLPLIVKGAACR
jgi:hypothetical protein